HIHLIIKIDSGTMWASSPTKSIPQIIKSLKSLVTKEIEKSIFQRSYHDHIIRDKNDYLKIWNYIDTNPQKWNEDCFYIK
ncbi:MAG: transposase, partial [Oscillospiraceae bacterium]|nr:transposase [Oscillospiraceae bacterium]